MKTVMLVNNYVGYHALDLAVERSDVVAVGVHPESEAKYLSEILSRVPESALIFDGSTVNHPQTVLSLLDLHPDLVLSAFFGFILRKDFLDRIGVPIINLHPALLPFNRGAYPNVWSIIDGTPAGVTLHLIDEGVDTGPVVAQRAVHVDATDTGGSLYRKLEQACVAILEDSWSQLEVRPIESKPQQPGVGTFHRKADVTSIDNIDLDQFYTGRQLIDLMRARTFEEVRGTFFLNEGRRIFVRLALETDPNDGGQ